MNSRNRAAQCDANPHLHDALLPRERQVLGMWDEGMAIDVIAALLGLADKTVKDITIAFDDRLDPSPDAAIRRGSALLNARIMQFHPHVALGPDK
jgi:FixJ family two-component response regulator